MSTVLLPDPGGPVKSITPRRAAVVSMKVSASLWEALAKISRDFSSAAKGARRNPHARRRSSTEAGVLAWREGSALIVVPPVVDLAIEVEIGLTSHSLGGGLMQGPPKATEVVVLQQRHLLSQQPAEKVRAFRQSFVCPPDAPRSISGAGGGLAPSLASSLCSFKCRSNCATPRLQ